MSLQTPTTQEINDNIIAQLEASLNQTIPLLPKSFLRVLAKTLAGVFILLYKYAGFTFLQIFVKTASASATTVNGKTVTPLNAWGELVGVGSPKAASNAELITSIIVEVQTGSLPAGTQLLNSTNGVTYLTIGATQLDSSTVFATVRASSDQAGGGGAGVIGNLDPGAKLSFANPLANVSRETTVTVQTITAADAESTALYRQRVLDRFQKRPQGGAAADYEIWGEETDGIVNVYPYTGENPGEVDVYSEATVASSGDPDGIPTPAQLTAVLASIELDENGLASRRPANAFVNSYPISRVQFDVRVLGLIADNLAQVKSDITAQVEAYFLTVEPFIEGLSVPPRRDRVSRSAVAGTVEDVVTAANGVFTTVEVFQSAVEIEVYSLGIGEKAKASAVIYI